MPYSDKNYSVNNVNYLNKDFINLKNTLIEYAKTYFPNTYQDFNETSPGMMLIEMGAYVGDVLSFYIDQQYKEMLLPLAEERRNIINISRMLGYKVKTTVPSYTDITVSQTVGADVSDLNNIKPNFSEALVIDKGMKLSSTSNSSIIFETLEEVDFSVSSSAHVPLEYSFNDTTKLVSTYKLTRKVRAISAETKTKTFSISSPKKFLDLNIPETNVVEIISIVDSNENKWYEVDYLAQDRVPIENHYTSDWVDGSAVQTSERTSAYIDMSGNILDVPVPYTLQYLKTSKRFIVKVNDDNTTSLIFGTGLLTGGKLETTSFLQTDQAGIIIPGETENGITDAINPLMSDSTTTLGETPSNTTLTVTYRVGGGVNANLPSADIATINSSTILNGVSTSGKNLQVTNEIPALGGKDEQSVEEIRNNALAFFSTQNRCVTKEDYEARVLNMPAKFGNIAKVYVEKGPYSIDGVEYQGEAPVVTPGPMLTNVVQSVQDFLRTYVENDSSVDPVQYFNFDDTDNEITDRDYNFISDALNDFTTATPPPPIENSNIVTNINIHLLAYDTNKNLVLLSPTGDETHPIKSNMVNYLGEYRILTDEVNLIDGKIINFGVAFKIISTKDSNKQDVKIRCINKIKEYFNIDKMQFRQPIYTSDLEYELMSLEGVRAIDYIQLTQNFNDLANGLTLSVDQNTLLFDRQYSSDQGNVVIFNSGDTDAWGNVHSGKYGWLYNFRQFYESGKNGIVLPSYDPTVFELKNPNTNIRGIVI